MIGGSTPTASSNETHFLEGIRLFNDGQYWHAHEQWEACWLESEEPDATFFKGIIQAAAALVHWQRGNTRGLWRNWYKSRPKLMAIDANWRGLDVNRLIYQMDRFVLNSGTVEHPPQLRLTR